MAAERVTFRPGLSSFMRARWRSIRATSASGNRTASCLSFASVFLWQWVSSVKRHRDDSRLSWSADTWFRMRYRCSNFTARNDGPHSTAVERAKAPRR
jgi:hypothetical protein